MKDTFEIQELKKQGIEKFNKAEHQDLLEAIVCDAHEVNAQFGGRSIVSLTRENMLNNGVVIPDSFEFESEIFNIMENHNLFNHKNIKKNHIIQRVEEELVSNEYHYYNSY